MTIRIGKAYAILSINYMFSFALSLCWICWRNIYHLKLPTESDKWKINMLIDWNVTKILNSPSAFHFISSVKTKHLLVENGLEKPSIHPVERICKAAVVPFHHRALAVERKDIIVNDILIYLDKWSPSYSMPANSYSLVSPNTHNNLNQSINS